MADVEYRVRYSFLNLVVNKALEVADNREMVHH